MSNTTTQKTDYRIKFGTDGWREIIADNYTVANVRRVAAATSRWILKQAETSRKVVVGYDCRFGGELFAKGNAGGVKKFGTWVWVGGTVVSTALG